MRYVEPPDSIFGKAGKKGVRGRYKYLQLDILTNPECSLASNSSLIAGGTMFSRDKGTLPNDFGTFRRNVSSAEWDALVCSGNRNQ